MQQPLPTPANRRAEQLNLDPAFLQLAIHATNLLIAWQHSVQAAVWASWVPAENI